MKIAFWLSLFGIWYAYFGYPLFMIMLSKIKKGKPVNKADITPFVSIVIPAYNEEKYIGAKLNEVLNLDYPKEQMEVYVVSDASSDRTDEVVRGFISQGAKLLRLEGRSGKIAAYRSVLPYLKGEIIVFSDATSALNVDSIRELVKNFNDPSVGCVGGLLAYVNPKQAMVGKGESKYWSYEKRVRCLESSLESLPSVSGTLYAVRKELYPLDLPADLAEDLIVPLRVRSKGLRAVYEVNAICRDFTTFSIREEVGKRARITVQNIRGLINMAEVLNPFKYGLFSLIVISHKIFRLLVPLFLLSVLVSNVFLAFGARFYQLVLLCQILFYVAAFVGYEINKRRKFSLGNALFYLLLSNYAILLGIARCCFKGERVVTWQTVRV